MRRVSCAVLSLNLATFAACNGDDKDKPKTTTPPAADSKKPQSKAPEGDADKPEGAAAPAWAWELPKGLTDPPSVPADNPMSAEKVELGHELFMDKRLSSDGSRSCYSCHQNHLGNADGRKTAMGPGEKILGRNSPTIWNVAYQPALYWDGRAPSLEKQAIGALKGGNMALGDGLDAKAEEIGNLDEYKAKFAKVFELKDGDKVTPDLVAKALSAYERTLLCGDTKWDKQELSEAATRGQALFMGKAGCVACHNTPVMSDGLFHVTGVAVDAKAEGADVGRFKVTEADKDKFAFRTPTLRNVARTAPYFHDGSVDSLEEAVKIMASGGKPQDGLTVDSLLVDRKLSDEEIKDLVAFLQDLDCPGKLEEIGDQNTNGIEPPGA
jgi:cytochrome c peroxidase